MATGSDTGAAPVTSDLAWKAGLVRGLVLNGANF